MQLYFFGWPANLGGASTKFCHTLCLLAPHYEITVVADHAACLADRAWRRFLEGRRIRCRLLADLPRRLTGWGVAMCHGDFFLGGILGEARRRGLRIAWSNDMMWHFPGELGAMLAGLVDAVLFVSDVQRAAHAPGCAAALGARPAPVEPGAVEGFFGGENSALQLRWITTGNYIDPAWFPFRDRWRGARREITRGLVAGRLSRADPDKFPDDFPDSYRRLGLRAPRFRVMAWSDALAKKWPRRFGSRWDLLPAAAEPQADFLRSLDLLVYQVGPRFRESWGRAVVEAALTGAIPLVPKGGGHHLENLVAHGVSGFHCASEADYRHCAQLLQDDPALRRKMSHAAREWTAAHLCNREEHLARWRRVFV